MKTALCFVYYVFSEMIITTFILVFTVDGAGNVDVGSVLQDHQGLRGSHREGMAQLRTQICTGQYHDFFNEMKVNFLFQILIYKVFIFFDFKCFTEPKVCCCCCFQIIIIIKRIYVKKINHMKVLKVYTSNFFRPFSTVFHQYFRLILKVYM